jgi:hypothetical protein
MGLSIIISGGDAKEEEPQLTEYGMVSLIETSEEGGRQRKRGEKRKDNPKVGISTLCGAVRCGG